MKAIRIIWGIAAVLIALYLVVQRYSYNGYKAGDIGVVVMLASAATLFFWTKQKSETQKKEPQKRKQESKPRRYASKIITTATLFFYKKQRKPKSRGKEQEPKSRRYTYNSIKAKLQIDRFVESEVEAAAETLYNSDFNRGKPVIEINRSGKRTEIEREDEDH